MRALLIVAALAVSMGISMFAWKFLSALFVSSIISSGINAQVTYGSKDWFYTDAEVAACDPVPVFVVIGDSTKNDIGRGTTREPNVKVSAKEGRMFDTRETKLFSAYSGENARWARAKVLERENGLYPTVIEFRANTHQGATGRSGVTVEVHAGLIVMEVAKSTACLEALELLPG
jgi:hypothetical protein